MSPIWGSGPAWKAEEFGHEMPRMVRKFLQKSKFHTDCFDMVLACGERRSGAAELVRKRWIAPIADADRAEPGILTGVSKMPADV